VLYIGNMLSSVALMVAVSQAGSGVLHRGPHPAFMYTPGLAELVFQNGLSDASRLKDPDSLWQPLTQGIGDVHRGYFSQTVSWLWAFPWQATVYQNGVRARKESWTSDQIDRYVDGVKATDQSHDQIAFRAEIRLQPSFDNNGAVDRYPDPSDLSSVRVFMKVGTTLYSPIQQPGTVPYTTQSGTTDVTTPETTVTTEERTVKDRHEKAHTETVTTTTDMHEDVGYAWYDSVFDFWFDLKNKDGSYRVTPADKQIEIIVMYGGNTRSAKYKLDDFDFTKPRK
jgi:hypothetical protein